MCAGITNNTKNKPIPSFVCKWHVLANEFVDKLARRAADQHELPPRCYKDYFKAIKFLEPIQYRAIVYIQHLTPRPKAKKVVPLKIPIEALLHATEHVLYDDGEDPDMMCCQVCCGRVRLTSPIAKQFLKAKCTPIDKHEFGLVIPIGSKSTHPSHALKLYGGVFLCIACGCVARSKITKLGSPCMPPTVAGRANLNAYRTGKPPTNCKGWPFREQCQNSFTFTLPTDTSDKELVLALTRVQDQVTAFAAGVRDEHKNNTVSIPCDTDSQECASPSTPAAVPVCLNLSTFDDPDLDPFDCTEDDNHFQESASYTEQLSPPPQLGPPPDDWLIPDDMIIFDSD